MARQQEQVHMTLDEAHVFARGAILAAGGHAAMAEALACATVEAEARGNRGVGFAHLPDYLYGLRAGRIDGTATPRRHDPAPALMAIDAQGGIAQTGFLEHIADLTAKAHGFGIALMAQTNSFTAGELGFYVERLARSGLVAIAATNGPALLAAGESGKPVYCTNPIAFAAPRKSGPPLLIDQSSSATAFVNIRRAAMEDRPIPEGWAVDRDGKPTTDAKATMSGALLAFGGTRGANIALMVEILAAGLSGANWSLDAPDFASGKASPATGLTIIAIAPGLLDPEFESRIDAQLTRLESNYGVHIPGSAKARQQDDARCHGIDLPRDLYDRICGTGTL